MDCYKVHELIKSVLVETDMVGGDVTIKNANVDISDGLMSEIMRVTVAKKMEHKPICDTIVKNLDLIIKVAPTDPKYRTIVKLLYVCEIFFYDTVVPLFNKLLIKYTGSPLDLVPRFFKAIKEDCKEVIVMEDLAPLGYKMLSKKFAFTDNCMKRLLKEFGKFHALSFALQKEDPDAWASLETGVDQKQVFSGEVTHWFQDALAKSEQLFQSNKSISVKLRHLHDNFSSEIKRLLTPSTKYPSVIVHMDPWCNNFLILHAPTMAVDEEPEINRAALIDFQQASKASPVLDISCFLYNNASAEAIYSWETYLRGYHESLCTNGRTLNCKIEDVYSWEMFMDDWKEYASYGLLKSVMGISLNTREEEDIPPLDLNNIGASFFVHEWNLKTIERIQSLIVHCDAEGVL